MKPRAWVLAVPFVLLAACGGHGLKLKKDTAMDRLSQTRANLAFTCRHERIPEASADSDLLFKYARWLQKNNQLKEDPAVDAEVERLYRIAAEHQHYKASINLINGAFRGHFTAKRRQPMPCRFDETMGPNGREELSNERFVLP